MASFWGALCDCDVGGVTNWDLKLGSFFDFFVGHDLIMP